MDSQNLSSDMIFEILTRATSLETLNTCKTVCNEWNRLIHESSFMPTYCQRTNNVSGYFLQDIFRSKYVSQFVSIDQAKGAWTWSNKTRIESLPHDTEILASCDNGLLCCVKSVRARNYRFYACKPSTKQWQCLPNPKTRYETTAIAIMVLDSNDYLRYKIVRLSRRGFLKDMGELYANRVEIFDSGNWSWSEKEDLILPYDERISLSPAVAVSSSVHWLTSEDNVLVLDSNSFDKFSLPEQVKKNDSYNFKKLLVYQGRLGFVSQTRDNYMELWVLDDPRNKQWVKKNVLNLEGIGEHVTHPSPGGFYNAEIAFLKAFSEVVFYKLQDRSYGTVKLDKMTVAREVFQFRSDLEPVNLRPLLLQVRKSAKEFQEAYS